MNGESVPAGMHELVKRIDGQEGVLTTTMGEVRDAYGSERLGVNVRNGIHELLLRLGIGHYPARLPSYQSEVVRLFRSGSPVGKLIRAALAVSTKNDAALRLAAASDPAKVLQKVRELVCS